LGKVCHPKPQADVANWLNHLVLAHIQIFISEVADYEVRRNLILHGKKNSIERLDELRQLFTFVPITTTVMLSAADMWAAARRRGRPTADLKELDCDVILAAQALEQDAIVATENLGHLSQFAPAYFWKDIVA